MEALLKRPHEPQLLGVAEYVAELNRRLRTDPSYRPGTRFVVTRPSADGRIGARPTWQGPDEMKPVVFRIVQSVVGTYLVETPFFSDR